MNAMSDTVLLMTSWEVGNVKGSFVDHHVMQSRSLPRFSRVPSGILSATL